ncbi:MAG: ABC transporter ATP-binding protein [Paracoccaceae bacterium]
MNDAAPVATPALVLDGVERAYGAGDTRVAVLAGAGLTLMPGEAVALVAPSGAGKSTLLQIAGLLDTPDAGTVAVAGRPVSTLDDAARTAARRDAIGFVYQFHHLLPEFSAEENVSLPQLAAGRPRAQARARSLDLLTRVGLGGRAHHRPSELSGGEQQRVAICRALANRPAVLLADEPTGNLDPGTAGIVFDVLVGLVRDTGLAALVATHNHDLARRLDRTVTLKDGRLV